MTETGAYKESRSDRHHRDSSRLIATTLNPKGSSAALGTAMRAIVGCLRQCYIPMLHNVWDFHEQFQINYETPDVPRLLPPDMAKLRVDRLQEELDEYREAVEAGDLVKALDALVDLLYILLGAVHLHGFTKIFGRAWVRVHAANMKKERAKRVEDSKHGSIFDIVKPEGWEPPYLDDLLAEARAPEAKPVSQAEQGTLL